MVLVHANSDVARSNSRLRHSRNARVEELSEEDRGIGLIAGTGCCSPEDAELLFLFLDIGLSASRSAHSLDGPRYLRVFIGERSRRVLHLSHRGIVVGNLPRDRPGESLGDMRLINFRAVRVEAVDHDFKFGAALRG